jgi:hypothetical protein
MMRITFFISYSLIALFTMDELCIIHRGCQHFYRRLEEEDEKEYVGADCFTEEYEPEEKFGLGAAGTTGAGCTTGLGTAGGANAGAGGAAGFGGCTTGARGVYLGPTPLNARAGTSRTTSLSITCGWRFPLEPSI